MKIDEEIKKAKAEVYRHHAFTPPWNEACRKLWALEDSKERSEQVLRISFEIAAAKTVRF
jgi:protein-disulfide isomerase